MREQVNAFATGAEAAAFAYSPGAMQARQHLVALRKRAGLSVRQMADEMGLKPSSYQHYEARYKDDYLPMEVGLKAQEVLSRHGLTQSDLRVLVEPSLDMVARRPVVEGTSTDLPVYSAAEAGEHGAMVLSGPVDWIVRPEPLMRVKDAFAVYVVGTSMEPAYNEGDTLLIDPGRPPLPDSIVILEGTTPDGSRLALLKQLVRRTGEHWIVRQYKPERELKLARSKWGTCHVVVGKFNAR